MKTLKRIICSLLISCLILGFVGCEQTNELDVSVYCLNDISYQLNDDKKTESTFELSKVIDASSDFQQYTRIQISTHKDWTYGLELERVELDILLSVPADIDIDITITNLENAQHLDEKNNTYYYLKTISINKESTPVKLDIDDICNNKGSVISFEINKSCYTSNPDLKIAIANFKMFGQHTPVNY